MPEDRQIEIADQFTERLLGLLEDLTARGIAAELVYNAAFCAAMTFASRRTTMLQQAKDLHAMAYRLETEDDLRQRPVQ